MSSEWTLKRKAPRGIKARLRAAAQRPTAPMGGRSPLFQFAQLSEYAAP